MICLGIESTAHTFGVGVVDDNGSILANEKKVYQPPLGWGMDPSKVKEHHQQHADEVIQKAIAVAKIDKPDLIAFSAGPGLSPALLIGMQKAKELAKKWGIPIVEVNHCVAHIEIGRLLSKFSDPVMLYVSGGNTQVIAFEGGRYRVFGETEDIGIGNLFDTFGRKAGMEFPAGPKIGELAKHGKKFIPIPYSVKGMDVAFSGIKTKCEQLLKKEKLEDICYSLTETAYAMLIEITERAMAHCQKKELILTGGVAASSRLQEMCRIMCEERGAKFSTISPSLAGDNGAQIAWTGTLIKKYTKNPDIYTRWRTDEVDVDWIK
jgi:glycoprotease/Kae1 family metallohydrolase